MILTIETSFLFDKLWIKTKQTTDVALTTQHLDYGPDVKKNFIRLRKGAAVL